MRELILFLYLVPHGVDFVYIAPPPSVPEIKLNSVFGHSSVKLHCYQ